MKVALPFCNKDADAVSRLLEWCIQLGGCPKHECVLVADCGVSWGKVLDLIALANRCFRSAKVVTNEKPTDGWIKGGNSLFFTALKACAGEPVFWLEPDCTPLKADWIEQIEAEYTRQGKPFLGMRYHCDSPSLPRENLSGIAVYPADAYERLRNWEDTTLNFDIAIAYVTVPDAAHTEMIQHYWGKGMPPIKPEAVVFHRDKEGILMGRRKRLDLSNVTLWAIAWGDPHIVNRIKHILYYCQTFADFGRIMLFSAYPDFADPWETILVPCGDFRDFNCITNRIVPKHISTEFALSVQEDGFPICPDLWTWDFLDYDYIGAPWTDGVVGNGGFYLESEKMLDARSRLPDNPDTTPPMGNADHWVCRTNRALLESQGVRFAPFELAERFSTERTGHGKPSFGFHGRTYNPEKYKEGWQLISQQGQ